MYNSTIIRKKKICITCNLLKNIFSHGNCQSCATVKSTEKRIAKYESDEEQDSRKNLIEDLDTYFSRYIRIKYANKEGVCSCYTCKKNFFWEYIQNGHYISRQHLATRFLDFNCRPQCEHCNCYLSGNLKEFKNRLDAEKAGTSDYLHELSREVFKPTIDDLKQLLIEVRYKLKIATLKFDKK